MNPTATNLRQVKRLIQRESRAVARLETTVSAMEPFPAMTTADQRRIDLILLAIVLFACAVPAVAAAIFTLFER